MKVYCFVVAEEKFPKQAHFLVSTWMMHKLKMKAIDSVWLQNL